MCHNLQHPSPSLLHTCLKEETKEQGLGLCVYPKLEHKEREDERNGCERMGWQRRDRREGATMLLGVTVEARLNGARAGKVSVQQGLTEEEVSQLHGRMTLNTAFHNVLKEKRRRSHLSKKRKRTQAGNVKGERQKTSECETCREKWEDIVYQHCVKKPYS